MTLVPFSAQLPALQVVLPLVAAPLCLLLRRPALVWPFCVAVSWAALAVAVSLLDRVLAEGVVVYSLGGWAAPWGIEYRVDAANAYVLLIINAIAAVTLPYAGASVRREIAEDRRTYFYALLMLCYAGLLGQTITGDAFNVFVFLEISSLSMYALIGLGQDRRALTSAFQYLVMGTIGGTFFLVGVGFLYAVTGTLNMADLAQRLPDVTQARTVQTAFALIVVGMGLKLALFPMHLWLPNAYAYAPSTATVFIAATATKVAVYVATRFVFTVFGLELSFQNFPLGAFMGGLALVGLLSASTVAIFQTNIKRMLAYSSVAQIGYMVLGMAFASVTGLTAGLLHLFNHALMKGALFMAMGCLFWRLGSAELKDMHGMARAMPMTFWAFVLGGLSLIGVPLTTGFVSKWYLILAALESGWWPVAVLILVGSLLAVIYIWRVVEVAWFQPRPEELPPGREAPPLMLAATWILVAANIYFGIRTELTAGVAQTAARALMGSPP